MYQFNLAAITPYFRSLPTAVSVTLEISAIALLASTLLGLVLAKARMRGGPVVGPAVRVYIEVFRNVPLLILLYVCFFGLAQIGLRLSGFWAAVLALILNSTAYLAEIFRAGYATIVRGQREAALSLGLHRLQTELFVVLPQVVRAIIPTYANQCVGVLLDPPSRR